MAKKKKKKDWKDESEKSMMEALLELDKEIFAMRNELSWNRKIEKPHRLKAMRKEKARILTMLTQKKSPTAKAAEA